MLGETPSCAWISRALIEGKNISCVTVSAATSRKLTFSSTDEPRAHGMGNQPPFLNLQESLQRCLAHSGYQMEISRSLYPPAHWERYCQSKFQTLVEMKEGSSC